MHNALYNLFYSLNIDFLNDLKIYTIQSSNHEYTLSQIISKYALKHKYDANVLEGIQELKKNNSIGCMTEYYELIDLMISEA